MRGSTEIDILRKYFPHLNKVQLRMFTQLKPIYEKWNAKINIISRKDIDFLYERHVLHSLSISKFIQFHPRSSLMDLGCGGGFPGIPLAIIFPEVSFVLVDSIGKKIKVVNEIVKTIDLKNVQALHNRAEKVKGPFDFVVTRAVAPINDLVKWTRKKYKIDEFHDVKNGLIALKGGDLINELASFKNRETIIHLSSYFEEPFFETKKIIHIPVK